MIEAHVLKAVKDALRSLPPETLDDFLVSYLHLLAPMSQADLNSLLLECLTHQNSTIVYTQNVLKLLSQYEKVNFFKIDVSLFKTLIHKQYAPVTDACLQFIDLHKHLFPIAFLETLHIEIEWLSNYLKLLILEMKRDGHK